MKILVSDLKPNPFRDMRHYPLDPNKIEALVASIKTTDFWDNLLARKSPDGKGYEQAYGHHRVEALKKAGVTEIDIPVRKLDDTKMAQIMAHENMEEWGHSAAIEQETVRAIIAAFGDGRIDLPSVGNKARKDQVRYAPSFIPGHVTTSGESHPYTVDSLVEFLGWKSYKVIAAIGALALIEQSIAPANAFVGLSSRQARSVAEEGTRVLRETKDATIARSVVRGLAAGFRKSSDKKVPGDKKAADVTIHSARRVANTISGKDLTPKTKKLPNFEKFIDSIAKATGWYFENKKEQWEAVVHFRADMPAEHRRRLIAALRSLIKQAERMINKLEA